MYDQAREERGIFVNFVSRLDIINFRNLAPISLKFNPGFNLFYGDNGSGKTSLLEALYYLSLGRSFRSHLFRRLIQHEAKSFSLFASIQQTDTTHINIGREKHYTGEGHIRIADRNVSSAVEMARLLPLQLINSNSYRLLDGGPKYRRQLIDWGMFHVEHSFFSIWQQFYQALQQRNAALKQKAPSIQIKHWDHVIIPKAESLNKLRADYVEQFKRVLEKNANRFLGLTQIDVEYYPGWNQEEGLFAAFERTLEQDRCVGHTQVGPQRTDLRLRIDGIPLQDVLSRGQQKFLVCLMHLSQGQLLREQTDQCCVYLLDDLASELDSKRRQEVQELLIELNAQVFITTVTPETFDNIPVSMRNRSTMFHVEHGQINLCS